jgi:hypothetical protein
MAKPAQEIDILYRTVVERERQGPYGALMRWIAARPLVAGAVGGVGAIGIALARGWKGASTLPEVAAIICVVVLLVWVGLFWMMRGFFERQTREQLEVVRRLKLADNTLVWTEGPNQLLEVDRPVWRMLRAPGVGERGEQPWPVWILAAGTEAQFVLETRVMWDEASKLAAEEHQRDELLPSHVASPFLELARAQRHDL